MTRIWHGGLLLKLLRSWHLIVLLDCLLHLMIGEKLVQKLRLLNLIKLCLVHLILEQCGCWPSGGFGIQCLILHELFPLLKLLEFGTAYRVIELFRVYTNFVVLFNFLLSAYFV